MKKIKVNKVGEMFIGSESYIAIYLREEGYFVIMVALNKDLGFCFCKCFHFVVRLKTSHNLDVI